MAEQAKRSIWLYLLPAFVFMVVAAFLYRGLALDPRKVPSPLIDKPAPEFQLPVLQNESAMLAPADMAGKVWLLNVWASWCVSCRAEHEVLKALARQELAPIIGLNYKDHPTNARQWLRDLGDPYTASIVDADGKTGIDWGVYGVPETFVIDRKGIVRYKHIGPVSARDLRDTIIPLINKLTSENA